MARPWSAAFGEGVGPLDIERIAPADADTAALPDGEVVEAAVLPDNPAVTVDDLSGPVLQAAVALQERALSLPSEETQVLALDLRGHRQIRRRGRLAHPR